MKNPYMPLWVNDYMRGTRLLTLEQKGLYMDILLELWLEGELTDDIGQLAKLFNVNSRTFKKIWEVLRVKFDVSNGRITHQRILKERLKMISKSEKNTLNGSKGGKAKANARANAKDSPPRSLSNTDSDSDTDSNTDSKKEKEKEKTAEAVAPPTPADVEELTNNLTAKVRVSEIEMTQTRKALAAYSDKIRFAATNPKNLYFVENCIRKYKYSKIMSAIALLHTKYDHESTPDRFKLGVQAFFDVEYINHVLSDKFVAKEAPMARQEDPSDGQIWVSEMIQKYKDLPTKRPQGEIATIDALYLVKTYLDKWKFGIKGDLLEKWVRKLEGKNKKAIQKAFDELLLSKEKPFQCSILIEVAKKHDDYQGVKYT